MTAPARLSSTQAVLDAFSRVGRDIMLRCLSRRSCIASVRVTIECLKRFGITVKPVVVAFVLEIPERNLAYTAGLLPGDKEKAKVSAGNFVDLGEGSSDGWEGHLVAAGNGFFIDPSFDQAFAAFSEAGHETEAPPMAVVFPVKSGRRFRPGVLAEYRAALDDGTQMKITYAARRDDGVFLSAPAWELDYLLPLISAICAEMKRCL